MTPLDDTEPPAFGRFVLQDLQDDAVIIFGSLDSLGIHLD